MKRDSTQSTEVTRGGEAATVPGGRRGRPPPREATRSPCCGPGARGGSCGRAASIASLHRSLGNSAVEELHENGDLQPKLDVSRPNDPSEREAERVADMVMRLSAHEQERPETLSEGRPSRSAAVDAARRRTDGATPTATADMYPRCIRRHRAEKPLHCEECETALQRAPTDSATAAEQRDEPLDSGPDHSAGDTLEIGRAPGTPQPLLRQADHLASRDEQAPSGGVSGMCSRCRRRFEQGKPLNCEDCEATIQRRLDPQASADRSGSSDAEPGMGRSEGSGTDTVADSLPLSTGGGRPLRDDVRSFFERRFDHDFGDVRIHTGPQADEVAGSIDAEAFTIGRHVAFARGNYRPGTSEGRELLAHELTHVVQNQRGASVSRRLVRRSTSTTASTSDSTLSSPRFRDDPVLEAVWDDERLLAYGNEGRAVTRIQHALVDAGHFLHQYGVDGKYGMETARAVRAFQREEDDLSPDGIVGPETLRALDERYGEREDPSTLPGTFPSLYTWNQECMLDILCEWNEQVIDDVRERFTLKEFDALTISMEVFDGTKWVEKTEHPGGYAHYGRSEIGIREDNECGEGAAVLYQEWFHHHQPRYLSTKRKETRAHRFEEEFRMYAGIEEDEPGFRRLDPGTGRTEVDVDAVESYILDKYPGVSERPGEVITGKVDNDESNEPADTEIELWGRPESREPKPGDKFVTDMDISGWTEVDTSDWRCTGDF